MGGGDPEEETTRRRRRMSWKRKSATPQKSLRAFV
jgi:hypothetical protein